MTTIQKVLFFFVLPFIAPLFYPLSIIGSAWVALLLLAVLFGVLGFFLLRGSPTALTLSIFIQGMNVVIRLMMLFPNLMKLGQYDIPWLITSLISISLSLYLVLRLDRTDVRVTLVI